MGGTRTCVVLFKTGILESGHAYGNCFDGLQPCCEAFNTAFYNTGNEKRTDWKGDLYYAAQPGLNLLIRGGNLELHLAGGDPVRCCPWCGAGIEIRHSRQVVLKRKTKVVDCGLEEAS
jgi:hypothetical protein